MLKRLVAPIAIAAVVLMQMTISSLNANDLTQQNESERNYFIKPVTQSKVVIVEPNYGHFFNPDPSIEKDESGEMLYSALEELNENYKINRTQMVSFERKGQIVPNLYVHIEDSQTTLAKLKEELPGNELLVKKPD